VLLGYRGFSSSGGRSRRGDELGGNENSDVDVDGDEDEDEDASEQGKAYFTYTPSIAWSYRSKDEDEHVRRERGHEDLGTGYMGDEVIVGIGIDDLAQGFVRVPVEELLSCSKDMEDVKCTMQ
jgi:hypothetical protein